jgi:polyvinyl alcohol dehydrogenase (cytochrome)
MAARGRFLRGRRVLWRAPGTAIATLSCVIACMVAITSAHAADAPTPDGRPDTTTAAAQAPAPSAATSHGATLFASACASCHLGQVAKAPHVTMLQIMSADSILKALTTGVMQQQAAALSVDDRRAVAEFLAGAPIGRHTIAAPVQCSRERTPTFDRGKPPFAAGWGIQPGNTRLISAADAGLAKGDLPNLELKWAFAYPDAVRARSAPVLAGGWLFVGSHNGDVYALEPATGCVIWTFAAASEVRTGIVVSAWQAGDATARPLAFFGDLVGNVYGIDAVTGTQVWRQKADEHPNTTITGTPSMHGDRLFVPVSSLEVVPAAKPDYPCCSFRGSVVAYRAATGERLWQSYTIAEPATQRGLNRSGTPQFGPSGAPIWNSPAIDGPRNQLYVGTGENYSSPATKTSDAIIAMDLDTGKIEWTFQATPNDAWNTACDQPNEDNCPDEDGPDFDFGAATVLAHASDGRDFVLGGQKSGVVHAVDPDTGALVWQTRVGRGGIQGGIHFGMAVAGDRVLVPINDMQDGRTYPDPAQPGLHALDLRTGAIVWRHPLAGEGCEGRPFCNPGISSAVTAAPDFVMAGGMDGVLRIHDVATGELVWSYATARPFDTISGAPGAGGSIGGAAGPIAADGMIFVNSGYGIYQHMPGNVLLAFGKKKVPDPD